MRRIPLKAARAFEAVARHKGVVGAAEELCVSPTTISHQLRTLEDFLGVHLFDRSPAGKGPRLYAQKECSNRNGSVEAGRWVIRG